MISLEGKTAVITGGNRGIGAATAMLFARAGADLVISYRRNAEAARRTAEEVEKLGRRCLAVAGDLVGEDEAARLITGALDRFGRLDILVNNHGIWAGEAIDTMTPELWDRTIAVNLRAVFLVTRLAVREMKRLGGGRIVNVSSTAG